jgi:antirestriction protein ArdC
VPVRIGGERAFYSLALDVIQMPADEAFHGPEQRAVVILHELAHASGRGPSASAMAKQPDDSRQAGGPACERRRKTGHALGEDEPITLLGRRAE